MMSRSGNKCYFHLVITDEPIKYMKNVVSLLWFWSMKKIIEQGGGSESDDRFSFDVVITYDSIKSVKTVVEFLYHSQLEVGTK